MAGTSGNPRARALGAELRQARERAGKGVRELAGELGFGHSKLSLWERGKKLPTTEDVASVLALLDVTGDERERMIEMARQAEQPNWLATGIPGIAEQLRGLMEFERTATEMVNCSPMLIPGPLQTGDYARGIMGGHPLADTQVAMRLGRRDILLRRNPVNFTALIGESALRQRIADPEVMVEQLNELLNMGKRPNVTIRVIPAATGFHPGLLGPFIVMYFLKSDPIAFLERHRASAFLFDDEDVAAFIEAANVVAEIAMSPADSARLIAEVIQDTETR